MSRRRPSKAEIQRVISLDLLADWRAYAKQLPEPRDDHDWRFFGSVTMDGETGALAWRAGNYGIGIGSEVHELGMWDRIKIDRILISMPPGHENVPRFAPSADFGMSRFSAPTPHYAAKRCS